MQDIIKKKDKEVREAKNAAETTKKSGKVDYSKMTT